MQEADPSYGGSRVGNRSTHTRAPATNAVQDDEEILDDVWPPKLPNSSRRYQDQQYTLSPEQIIQQGNKRFHVQYVDIPPRKSRQPGLPSPQQQYRYANEVETPAPHARRRRRIHPLFYFGVGMTCAFALVVVLFTSWNWIQIKHDDLLYGRPRTFQISVVVGHNDSPANPSHFEAINLNRHVEVIEWPGGDSSKMKVYDVTTLYGDGQDLTPVTLSFADLGNHKLDMLIHIQGTAIAFINENGTFRAAKPGEVKGLL
jgi:hypothetical protein